MVLARHLFPGAILALVGGLEGRIKRVVHLFEDHLGLVSASEIDLDAVGALVVVDTQSRTRIRPFEQLVGRIPIYVFDHHPSGPDDLPAAGGLVGQAGATVTLLVHMLQDRQVRLTPEEASLAYAGLWEDTGGFGYMGTTERDLEAGAFLAHAGAQPRLVGEWVREAFSREARGIFEQLLEGAEVWPLDGVRVVVAKAQEDGYVPALAPLAHTLMDLYNANAAFLLLALGEQRLIIARSNSRLHVGHLLETLFGGGGHEWAAFARIEAPLDEAWRQLKDSLGSFLSTEPMVGEIMTHSVETLDAENSVLEVLSVLRQRAFGGMPVMERGKVLGIARRRDLERAVHHQMGDAAVKGFMQRAVTVGPEASLSQVRELLREGAGRVLVEREGRLVGLFTRTDLYRYRVPKSTAITPESHISTHLPQGVRRVIEVLSAAFSGREGSVYLVGGTVRDALLSEGMMDLDLVLEGFSVAEGAAALVRILGGSYGLYTAFGTARVRLDIGLELDLAEAREEDYAYPGALPVVRKASIQRDLARRDFTVNAIAYRVWPGPPMLLDPFGGLADLKARLLRPLHPVSFVEDPSRILRGERLLVRLGFNFSEEAAVQLATALDDRLLARASMSRMRDELILSLRELYPLKVLTRMAQDQILKRVFGLDWGPPLTDWLSALEALRPAEAPLPEAYLRLLVFSAPDPSALASRFSFPRKALEGLEYLGTPPASPEHIRRIGLSMQQAFLAVHPSRRSWLMQTSRVLRGRDVLELGVREGPLVGEILREVALARSRGEVSSFSQERALARKLVKAYDWTS